MQKTRKEASEYADKYHQTVLTFYLYVEKQKTKTVLRINKYALLERI